MTDDRLLLSQLLSMLASTSNASPTACAQRINAARATTSQTQEVQLAKEMGELLAGDMSSADDARLDELVQRGEAMLAATVAS